MQIILSIFIMEIKSKKSVLANSKSYRRKKRLGNIPTVRSTGVLSVFGTESVPRVPIAALRRTAGTGREKAGQIPQRARSKKGRKGTGSARHGVAIRFVVTVDFYLL